MAERPPHRNTSWFRQRWLRWGLTAVASYVALVCFSFLVLIPLGMFFHWFGPIVGIALVALLNWPFIFFPRFTNPGFEVGTLVLLQILPVTLVYFLLGMGAGAYWPASSEERREPKPDFLLTAGVTILVLVIVLGFYHWMGERYRPSPLPPIPLIPDSERWRYDKPPTNQ